MQHSYRLFLLILPLFLPAALSAQKYEAELAVLAGDAAKEACAACSGGHSVAQREGSLVFTVSFPKEGFYNISLRAAAPSGEKTNILEIGGNTLNFKLAQNSQYVTLRLVSAQRFPAGTQKVSILKSWGWINIDYLEVEAVNAADRFNLNQTLVTANPTREAKALYDFLLDHYGDKIISGVMTLNPMDEVNWLKENTGKEPALVGIDFMHSGRNYAWYNDKEPILDAKAWYGRNGIPALMWHWRDPSRRTEEFYTRNASKPEGTDFDISKIADVNSPEYKAMLADIDYVAGLLRELQDQGVPVIWRPLHEAAGGWFWWGAKGPAPLKALWRLTYDRMVHHHGLKNLIWVWTREPNDDDWYPGDAYADIVGRDVYKDGDHSSRVLEFGDMNYRYGGKKMLALSETGSFPDVDNLLKDGAAWSWYMPWYGKYTRESTYNSLDLWKKTLAHDYVITLDEMPALKNYVRQAPPVPPKDTTVTGIDRRTGKSSLQAYPTLVRDKLLLRNGTALGAIEIYNTLGVCVRRQAAGQQETIVSFSGLPSGCYLVAVDGNKPLKVWKE